MMEAEPSPASEPITSAWDAALPELRDRYAGVKDGVLFCIWKLQQDPNLTLRDFRDEARLRGIGLSGRSLHSAKVLLGWLKPSVPAKEAPPSAAVPATPRARRARPTSSDGVPLEDQLIRQIQRIQEDASAESRRLEHAIREAIRVLEKALSD